MMCSYWKRSPRNRRLMAIGNFSLVLGLLLRMFVHPAGANQGWFDTALGLFFGISIGINLFVLQFGGRCRDAEFTRT